MALAFVVERFFCLSVVTHGMKRMGVDRFKEVHENQNREQDDRFCQDLRGSLVDAIGSICGA